MCQNKSEIREQLELLLKTWAGGQVDLLDNCVAEECKAYFSTHWNAYVRNDLKFQLQHTGRKKDVSSIRIVSEASRVQGARAAQIATVIGHFADKDSGLIFGGTFNNLLEKVNGKWWLTDIRFELQTDSSVQSYHLDENGILHSEAGAGDLAFIEKWKKVNTAIGLFVDQDPAQGKHTIMAEFDAPWYALPNKDAEDHDEDEIRETLMRYGYAVDFYCPDLLASAIAEDAEVQFGEGKVWNGRDAVGFLTLIRQASARSFHALQTKDVSINGGSAAARAIRLMPEKGQGIQAEESDLLAGQYDLRFAKTAKGWQISKLHYQAV